MRYKHWSECEWDYSRWPNFKPNEPKMACPCCGEYYHDPEILDMLQKARTVAGVPFAINSGTRCLEYNKCVGGVLKSEHLIHIAFDISVRNVDRKVVYEALKEAGFTTFGFYQTFIHVDKRPGRRWFGTGGHEAWKGVV